MKYPKWAFLLPKPPPKNRWESIQEQAEPLRRQSHPCLKSSQASLSVTLFLQWFAFQASKVIWFLQLHSVLQEYISLILVVIITKIGAMQMTWLNLYIYAEKKNV